mmetsp:Transcript_125952/g.350913  ORF Transcript_125952/g.350913 Transcript_125952/m.350913 type:complete len:132 (+) Transcript_125952:90-485(+)
MAAAPALAKSVVAMADSRREAIYRELGLPDMVEYLVEVTCDRDDEGWVRNEKIFIISETGFDVMTPRELGLQGLNTAMRKVSNILRTIGYQPCVAPHWRESGGLPKKGDRGSVWFKLKVPRSVALQHLDAM